MIDTLLGSYYLCGRVRDHLNLDPKNDRDYLRQQCDDLRKTLREYIGPERDGQSLGMMD